MRCSQRFNQSRDRARRFFLLAVFFLAAGWGGSEIRAAVIDVTTANVEGNIADDDTTTKNLQEIVDDGATKSGDVIQFAPGTYEDVGELLVTKPLTFRKDPGADGDAVITGKFMLHIRSKDVKVEDLTFRNVIFPDMITVEKNPTDPLTVGEEYGAWFGDRNFSIDRFLLGRKAANSDGDDSNDDSFTGTQGLDYSNYEGGIARKDLASFLQDGPDRRSDGSADVSEYATANVDWYKYNPTALVTDKDGVPVQFDTGAKVDQSYDTTTARTNYNPAVPGTLGNNPKWRFYNFRPVHPMRWLKDYYGVITINSRYRHGRTTCPEGGEVTGIEISRNVFDGTEVSAVAVNRFSEGSSVCEEGVSVVGNTFDGIGVADSEYLRDSDGSFITDGDGYRISEPHGFEHAVSLRDVKTALVSDNVVRAATSYQIFVQGAPEGARIMIRNNLLEAATTPGSRLWGRQIAIAGERPSQPDDVEITIMNNRVIGSSVPYSTYHYRDFKRFLWGERRLCPLYPTLHEMELAELEELLEPRIWRSYVPGFPYPNEDGSSTGARTPLPPEAASPASLTRLISGTSATSPYVTPLTDDVVIGDWDVIRFKDCTRSARVSVEFQRGVSIVGNDLGYVAPSSAAGSERFRSVVADGHGEDSEGPGSLRFGVALRGDGARLREFRGNNIEYSGIRAVDVFDTQVPVSAKGNFLGIRGYVSDSVSEEGTLDAPIVRAEGDAVGPRPEMRARPTVPAVEGASAAGAALTLTFSEALDGKSAPVETAFSVRGATSDDGTPVYDVVENGVEVEGATVRLTLDRPIAPGTTGVTVSYTKPADGNVLAAAEGDEEVDSFSGQAVTTGPPPAPAPGADSAGGGGDGGCSLASAGGAGVVSAAFALLPLLFALRRSGERKRTAEPRARRGGLTNADSSSS